MEPPTNPRPRVAPPQAGSRWTLGAALMCCLLMLALPEDAGAARSALLAAASVLVAAQLFRGRTKTPGQAAAVSEADKDRERWRAIVDTATEGIVTTDAKGTIETVNDAALAMFGYQEDELIGQNVNVLMPSPYKQEHDSYLRHYLETGERRIIGLGREVTGLRRDGSVFPIDLSVGQGRVGEAPFFTAITRDATSRKHMEAQLAQSERLAAVGELAAGVAHEINNPVNTMINCAQLIADGDDPQENSQFIIEEGGRIAEIVEALLQFARDDRDSAQPTSLAEVTERTLRLVGESWTRHGIQVSVEMPPDLPPVHARPQRLQQVLLNLMTNAKDALLEAPNVQSRAVSLQASAAEGGVELAVADNGPGLPGDLHEKVFEPFITTKRARGGTGLGLAISRSIVEGYGGTLEATSAAGEGTTFSVWLPTCAAE